jgi:hypothetical protein
VKKSRAQTFAHRLDKLPIEHPELVVMLIRSDFDLVACKIDTEVEDGETVSINEWLEVF